MRQSVNNIPPRYNPKASYGAWRAWMETYQVPMTRLAKACSPYWNSALYTLHSLAKAKELSVLYLARLYGAQEALPPTEIKGIVPDDLARAMIDEYPALRLQDWQAIVEAMRPYVRDGGKLYPKPEALA